MKNVALYMKNVSLEENISLEIKFITSEMKNVSLEGEDISSEMKNVSLEVV